MAKYLIEDTTLTNIADAIRENNTMRPKEPITPEEMPLAVAEVYMTGEIEGRGSGYTQGLEAGVEQGKKSAYDEFWDTYQQNGNRTDYRAAFAGDCWTTELFKPKYPMYLTHAAHLFFHNGGLGMCIDDFVVYCEENNIILDFSNCTNALYALASLNSPHLGVLDFSNCTNLSYLFEYNGKSDYGVRTIDKFISSETTKFSNTTFRGATKLTNLNMEGVIASDDFDVAKCTLLTHDSLMSIINCLKDVSGEGVTKTCTLGTKNLAKISDEEKAIATQKGWTLA